MSSFKQVYETNPLYETNPPIFINDAGVKFWLHKGLNDYLKQKKLRDYVCFFVKKGDEVNILLTKHEGEGVCESKRSEDIAAKIDFLVMSSKK